MLRLHLDLHRVCRQLLEECPAREPPRALERKRVHGRNDVGRLDDDAAHMLERAFEAPELYHAANHARIQERPNLNVDFVAVRTVDRLLVARQCVLPARQMLVIDDRVHEVGKRRAGVRRPQQQSSLDREAAEGVRLVELAVHLLELPNVVGIQVFHVHLAVGRVPRHGRDTVHAQMRLVVLNPTRKRLS